MKISTTTVVASLRLPYDVVSVTLRGMLMIVALTLVIFRFI